MISKKEILQRLPNELFERLAQQFSPSDFEFVLKGFSVKRNPVLRLNPLRKLPSDTLAALQSQGIQLRSISGIKFAYESLNTSENELLKTEQGKRGEFLLQGLTSQIPPLLLDPKPGENIWDMCAAPGSKTSQLVTLSNNEANITASEKDEIRVQKLQNTLMIQNCAQVKVLHADAVSLSSAYPEYFNAILLDAPCSAEGRIDISNPRSYKFWTPKVVKENAKLQRRLFTAAVRSLKKKGRILYSTCTLSPEENFDLVKWAINEFSGQIRHIPLKTPFSFLKEREGNLLAIPNEKMEGFFIARFDKHS